MEEKLSLYVPKSKQHLKLIERLKKLARRRERSVNYLVVQALLEYVEREEKREA